MEKGLVNIVVSSEIPNLWSSREDYKHYKAFINERSAIVKDSFLVYSPKHGYLRAFLSETQRISQTESCQRNR